MSAAMWLRVRLHCSCVVNHLYYVQMHVTKFLMVIVQAVNPIALQCKLLVGCVTHGALLDQLDHQSFTKETDYLWLDRCHQPLWECRRILWMDGTWLQGLIDWQSILSANRDPQQNLPSFWLYLSCMSGTWWWHLFHLFSAARVVSDIRVVTDNNLQGEEEPKEKLPLTRSLTALPKDPTWYCEYN